VVVTATVTAVWAAMISMAIGAYLGTYSEVAFQRALVAHEQWEMEDHPEEELAEMRAIYQRYGFSSEEVEVLLRGFQRDPSLWLNLMVRDEHGVLPETWESPVGNALVMAVAVCVGSLPALIPNLVMTSAARALPAVVVLAALTSVALGWATAKLTKQRTVWIALRFFGLAAAAMILGSGMGSVLRWLR
jgi:VIT1/CCC1 family predicted Fe2+/Mn2+ transporter